MVSTFERVPSLEELPPLTFDSVCMSLDSGAVHNWRSLANHLKDYTYQDIMQLSIVERRGDSASKSLLYDLNSRGWTVVDLAELSLKAGALEVIHILQDYCREYRPDIALPGGLAPSHCVATGCGMDTPTSTAVHIDTGWKSAKTCFHRQAYPSTIAPPLDAMAEAQRRYGVNPATGKTVKEGGDSGCGLESPINSESNVELRGTSPNLSSVISLESLPTSDLPEVPYDVLKEASGHFDQLAYREGGHKLGSGGFGEVFHCQLNLLGAEREVAVKALLTKDELLGVSDVSQASMESTERRQFITEIQALSNLSHPHLLPVLGYSSDGPRLCLVFPFMANGSLDAHLNDRLRLTPEVRVQVACDVSSALSYLHSGAGHIVVHRDVKSANILLTGGWRGMLGDFGVARSLPSTAHTSLHTTAVVGTRVYMSDEFSKGTISPAADTYAFGVVLFELLTGYCAQSVQTASGETTDLISFIDEDCEDIDELMGEEWKTWKGAWHFLWSLAESCVSHLRSKRPSSTEVWTKLQQTMANMRTNN